LPRRRSQRQSEAMARSGRPLGVRGDTIETGKARRRAATTTPSAGWLNPPDPARRGRAHVNKQCRWGPWWLALQIRLGKENRETLRSHGAKLSKSAGSGFALPEHHGGGPAPGTAPEVGTTTGTHISPIMRRRSGSKPGLIPQKAKHTDNYAIQGFFPPQRCREGKTSPPRGNYGGSVHRRHRQRSLVDFERLGACRPRNDCDRGAGEGGTKTIVTIRVTIGWGASGHAGPRRRPRRGGGFQGTSARKPALKAGAAPRQIRTSWQKALERPCAALIPNPDRLANA